MNRRLNPDLFDPLEKKPEVELNPSSGLLLRQLQEKLEKTGKKLSTVETLVELLQSRIKIMDENEAKKTEAFSKAITDLEKNFQEESLQQKRELQEINHRLRNKEEVAEQIESLVGRFNNNLSQFENKMAALRSMVSEREMNLMSYREIIEQLVQDVEKLKSKKKE